MFAKQTEHNLFTGHALSVHRTPATLTRESEAITQRTGWECHLERCARQPWFDCTLPALAVTPNDLVSAFMKRTKPASAGSRGSL